MGEKHEFKVGDTVLLKVGRNEVQAKILKPMAGGKAFMVKSLASGKDFIMPSSRLNVPTVSIAPVEPKQKVPSPVPVQPETEDASPPHSGVKTGQEDVADGCGGRRSPGERQADEHPRDCEGCSRKGILGADRLPDAGANPLRQHLP